MIEFTHKTYSRAMGGFTLIEILITIAVASVLLSVAIPSFKGFMINNRLTAQANELAAAIQLGRSEAIKRNANVSLCRVSSDSATSCVTSTGTWNYWALRAANGTIIRRGVTNTEGLKVSSTLTNDTVVFSPDGLAYTNNVVVSNKNIKVCSSGTNQDNVRTVTLGGGSRISTVTSSGTC